MLSIINGIHFRLNVDLIIIRILKLRLPVAVPYISEQSTIRRTVRKRTTKPVVCVHGFCDTQQKQTKNYYARFLNQKTHVFSKNSFPILNTFSKFYVFAGMRQTVVLLFFIFSYYELCFVLFIRGLLFAVTFVLEGSNTTGERMQCVGCFISAGLS